MTSLHFHDNWSALLFFVQVREPVPILITNCHSSFSHSILSFMQ